MIRLPPSFGSAFLFMLCTAISAPAFAQPRLSSPGESLADAAARAVHVRLFVDHEATLAPGGAGMLALTFDIAPGWHLYWHNPGDSGFPITWTINAPSTITLGEPLWPVPERALSPGEILDYTYEREVTLLFPISTRADRRADEPVTITADVEWLVCREGCVPGGARATLSIPSPSSTHSAVNASARADVERIERARRMLPQAVTDSDARLISIRWEGSGLHIRSQGAEGMTFFPYESEHAVPVDMVRRGVTQGDELEILYKPSLARAERVRGIVGINRAGETRYYLIDQPPPKIP